MFTLIAFLSIIILPDIFLYFKLKKHKVKPIVYILNFLPTIFFIALFIFIKIANKNEVLIEKMHILIWLNFTFILIYFPKLLYVIFYFLNYLINLFLKEKTSLIRYAGLLVAMFMVMILLYGAFINPLNVEAKNIEIEVKNLPAEFDGYKIIQISDIHLGSWGKRTKYLETAIYTVNKQEADILVFTGDIVNNSHKEMDGWKEYFLRFEAKEGKFAILGNHDYGDYSNWKSEADKLENFNLIKQNIQDFGFQLICNEAVKLQKDSSFIELVGVENWGKPPFPQYGDLELALQDTDSNSVKILLTHDPSHWKAEVLGREDIVLSLSGHTHAAQMSFNMYGKRCSPSAWLYKEWDGLYQTDNQYLYVNRGLGYIGVPVRLGAARPEVTIITLHNKQTINEM